MRKKEKSAPKELKNKVGKIVSVNDIIEEVILVEDPEIAGIQEETILPDEIVDEGWGEADIQIRKTQMGEIIDDTIIPFEELEKRQMEKVLGNKTVTYSDDDDTARQVWNEKYFEE